MSDGMTIEQMIDWLEAQHERLVCDHWAECDIPLQIADKLRDLSGNEYQQPSVLTQDNGNG